jgi:precorrin-2 methylase
MSNIPTAEEFIIQKQKELGYNPMNKVSTTEIKNNMKKTKLIPFDLERWQKGDFKRVLTNSGKEVSYLTYFESATEDTFPLVGVLENEVESWTINGVFSTIQNSSLLNLMLEVEDKTLEGWVNVYEDKLGGTVFADKDTAIRHKFYDNYITTIQITYNNDNDM